MAKVTARGWTEHGNQRGRTYVWLEATIKEDVLDVDHKRIGFEKLWFYATNNKKYKFRPTISQVEEQVRPGSQARDVPEHEPVGKIPKTDLCYGVEVGKDDDDLPFVMIKIVYVAKPKTKLDWANAVDKLLVEVKNPANRFNPSARTVADWFVPSSRARDHDLTISSSFAISIPMDDED